MYQKRSFILAAVLMLSVAFQSSPSSAAESEDFYRNGRFNFAVSYPDVFVGQGEAINGDGERFKTRDGKAEFAVYGMWQMWPLAEYYKMNQEWSLKEGTITFKILRRTFFVISGFKGTRIYYHKTYLKDGVFKTFEIEYESADRAKYDPIVTRMSNHWH